MIRLKKIFLGVLVSLLALSCAENKDSALNALTTASFQAWMAKYAPGAEATDDGVYVEYLGRSANWEELTVPDTDSSWIKMSYTGYTLQKNIFTTRDSMTAEMLGTWLPTTHFADDFEPYYVSNTMCSGLFLGLGYLRAGDTAKIYIPMEMGFGKIGMSQNSGYAGTTSGYLGAPIIFDVIVSEVVNNAYTWEVNNINRWVEKNWGMSEADTIEEGLYVRIIDENPVGDSIGKDSTIKYNYSTYFLEDGQLIATTLESVAVEAGYYSSSASYTESEMTPSNYENSEVTYAGLGIIVQQMRQGETAEAIIPSWLAEGIGGKQENTPEILPYQSQRVVITVLDDPEEEEEEEDSEE